MNNFYMGHKPQDLIEEFGSPLYVYNESIFRERIRELKNLVKYPKFHVSYSSKANSNLALLQIANEEGICIDAMSDGEILFALAAGFSTDKIFYIPNNVSAKEMQLAIDRDILISVDSLSQLETYGKINSGGKVAIRFNPGVGLGHHATVVTGGKQTKFGVNEEYVNEAKEILAKYNLKLVGINQHVGSLFLEYEKYFESVDSIFRIAKNFEDLEFVDIGGGFGIPYHKQEGQNRLDLKSLGERLDEKFEAFAKDYGKELTFQIEPGRYVSAECSSLLGVVNSIKFNGETKYIGTDIGFNVLIRPMLYDAYHEINVYSQNESESEIEKELVTIVGNICESGDVLAKNRILPKISEGDVISVSDTGAYGHVMSSNYNSRLRPAEVLIRENGELTLIRRRDTHEDLLKLYNKL